MSTNGNSEASHEPETNGQNQSTPISPTAPLAASYLTRIRDGKLDPKLLSDDQRRICVEFMIHDGKFSSYEMGQILGVSIRTITRDRRKIHEGNEISALVIDEAHYAQEMIDYADDYAVKLAKEKKYRDAWEVRRECAAMLQSMGFIKKISPDLNIKGTISLKEVFESVATEPFTADQLSPRFSKDVLEGFVDTASQGPVESN